MPMVAVSYRHETVSYWIANAVYRAKQKQKSMKGAG